MAYIIVKGIQEKYEIPNELAREIKSDRDHGIYPRNGYSTLQLSIQARDIKIVVTDDVIYEEDEHSKEIAQIKKDFYDEWTMATQPIIERIKSDWRNQFKLDWIGHFGNFDFLDNVKRQFYENSKKYYEINPNQPAQRLHCWHKLIGQQAAHVDKVLLRFDNNLNNIFGIPQFEELPYAIIPIADETPKKGMQSIGNILNPEKTSEKLPETAMDLIVF